MPTLNQRVHRSAQRTNWTAVAVVLLLGTGITIALAVGFTTRSDTRTVVKEREVAGAPCIRVNGVPSEGCDRLAKLLAETCSLRPKLCKETVSRALRSKSARVRRDAAIALGAGLAAAGIRGSISNPTVAPTREEREQQQRLDRARERTRTGPKATTGPQSTTTPTDTPGVAAEQRPKIDTAPLVPAESKRDDSPKVTTETRAVSVTTPSVPPVETPSLTTPSIPPEIPVVPPVTIPEVPVPPVTVPDPLPGAGKHPLCDATAIVRPCKPGK